MKSPRESGNGGLVKFFLHIFSRMFRWSAKAAGSKGGVGFMGSHLSKHPSDLKQNGTQEKTQFSSTVFHALSHGVICFVASVSSTFWLVKFLDSQSETSIQWFLKLTLATKWSTPCERYVKMCHKVVVFLVYHFV